MPLPKPPLNPNPPPTVADSSNAAALQWLIDDACAKAEAIEHIDLCTDKTREMVAKAILRLDERDRMDDVAAEARVTARKVQEARVRILVTGWRVFERVTSSPLITAILVGLAFYVGRHVGL